MDHSIGLKGYVVLDFEINNEMEGDHMMNRDHLGFCQQKNIMIKYFIMKDIMIKHRIIMDIKKLDGLDGAV